MALNPTLLGTEMLAALMGAAPITNPADFCNVLAGAICSHITANAQVLPGDVPTGFAVTIPPAGPVPVLGIGKIT